MISFETVAYSSLAHPYLLALFAAMTLGEESIIFLALLAGEGLIPLWIVFIFGFIGQSIFDNLLFLFVRSNTSLWIKNRYAEKEKKGAGFIKKFGKGNPFLLLLGSKFVYGTRILSMFYIANNNISFVRYFIYDCLALMAWFSIMVPLGWFAGRGFSQFLNVANELQKILGFAVLLFVVIYITYRLISFSILKRYTN